MTNRTVYTLMVASILSILLFGCKTSGVAVSGDGRQVAVSHAGSLWVADVEKEEWQKVPVEGGTAASPTWSPDGRYVLFEFLPTPSESATVSTDASSESEKRETEKTETEGAKPSQPTTSDPATPSEPTTAKPGAYAALFDTQTQTTTPLPSETTAPFAWRSDSIGFTALQRKGDSEQITSFGINGVLTHTLPVAKGMGSISQLIPLPLSNDVIFLTSEVVHNQLQMRLFCTKGDTIHKIAQADDIVGIGYAAKQNLLLWAKASSEDGRWRPGRSWKLALTGYDLNTDAVKPLPFPEHLSFLHPISGSTSFVDSVVFSPNADRMALLVHSMQKSKRPQEADDVRMTCYSVETNGSGACFIRQTEPNFGILTPVWSQDGRRLVLLEDGGESPRLFVYNYDGTGKRMKPLPTEHTEVSSAR